MILTALLFIAAADVGQKYPENWICADNLIEKNFTSKLAAGKLAGMIVDECIQEFDLKAYGYSPADIDAARMNYKGDRLSFLIKVMGKIEKRRERAVSPLKR